MSGVKSEGLTIRRFEFGNIKIKIEYSLAQSILSARLYSTLISILPNSNLRIVRPSLFTPEILLQIQDREFVLKDTLMSAARANIT